MRISSSMPSTVVTTRISLLQGAVLVLLVIQTFVHQTTPKTWVLSCLPILRGINTLLRKARNMSSWVFNSSSAEIPQLLHPTRSGARLSNAGFCGTHQRLVSPIKALKRTFTDKLAQCHGFLGGSSANLHG